VSLSVLAVGVVLLLVAGYLSYGRFIGRLLGLSDAGKTPAHTHADGADFAPVPAPYLLGQHFSAIAAAGPIVGPINACLQFGWLPCVLWIVLGSVLIGAVHDLAALVASVRHDAKTIAELVRQHLSPRAWVAFMAFIWLALLYVIVAFTDVTASTFIGKVEELEGTATPFSVGGAVAFASVAYLGLAVIMGLIQRRFAPPLWALTVVFVPATLGAVWLGTQCSTWLAFPDAQKAWGAGILVYCFAASLLPMWVLMQPRGYLGGFVLYLVLAVGVIGILFGDFPVEQAAFKGYQVMGKDGAVPLGTLFPFLFVTIACGACSGFHGLVCSGTTSKQIDKESDCKPVGYGAMLLEGIVAIIALTTVMMLADTKGLKPGAIYGQGIGKYLTVIVGKDHLQAATVFGSMALSTFVFDTLDVATRLGRYCLQELFGAKGPVAAAAATAGTIGLPLVIILTSTPGGAGYLAYWTLFGASNQLLAGLTLLGITVWLRRTGRPAWFVAGPMVFVLVITVTALVQIVLRPATAAARDVPMVVNAVVSALLLGLAGLLVWEAVLALRRPPAQATPPVAPEPVPA
jgi:carbon starvation protein